MKYGRNLAKFHVAEPIIVQYSTQTISTAYTSAPTNPTNDMAFLGERMEEFLAPPDADFNLLISVPT
jgi:hypothetical protein